MLALCVALGCGGHVTRDSAAGGAGQTAAGAPSAGAAGRGDVAGNGAGGDAVGGEAVGGEAPNGGNAGVLEPPGGAGGGAGSAVVAEDVNVVAPSPGCGDPTSGGTVFGGFGEYSVPVSGQTLDPAFSVEPHDRHYFVWLPKDYDNTKPYRVTFQYMGCGDRNAGATQNYRLMSQDPESIYVGMNMAPAGLPPAGKDCFDVSVGKQSVEWEFMGLVASAVQRVFCVDEHRLFVAGYSAGASVANFFGCYFAGKDPNRKFGPDIMIRGQSGVSGTPVLADVPCSGEKAAALWIHDTDDKENLLSGNQGVSLPRVLAANGCTNGLNGPHVPWGSTTLLNSWCTRYAACPAEYPVVFCTTSGRGHSAQDDLAIPGFIEFQNLMNPQ